MLLKPAELVTSVKLALFGPSSHDGSVGALNR